MGLTFCCRRFSLRVSLSLPLAFFGDGGTDEHCGEVLLVSQRQLKDAAFLRRVLPMLPV